MRKRHYILAMVMAFVLSAQSQVTYQPVDSLTVCRMMRQAPANASTLWFARQLSGVPYVAHTLEVNDCEQVVVNTRQLDCTTLVETVLALKLCVQQGHTTFSDYVATLQKLRYRDGQLAGYTSRLHYFTDWIDNNVSKGLVEEVQAPNPPFTAVQEISLNYMSRHPQSYKALKANPELVPIIRSQEQQLTGQRYRYIPKSAVTNSLLMRQTIRDGDLLAITTSKAGLDIAHLGFAVWRKDGLHLLNASQLHKKVVTEPMTLRQYLSKHPTFTGIRVVRLSSNIK